MGVRFGFRGYVRGGVLGGSVWCVYRGGWYCRSFVGLDVLGCE